MPHRYQVLAVLSVLAVITYIDRVCIAVAGPRMQHELGIGPEQWGWVLGAFALSYALFEIPAGRLGDRIGARNMLTRIVWWWSAFTALTGAVSSYPALLAARFAFGAGEAGAFHGMSGVVLRQFALRERSRAFGVIWMASQLGAALSPALVVPIQSRYGWRASFYVFAATGILWGFCWFLWYRDAATASALRQVDWRGVLTIPNVPAVMAVAFCYCFAMNFFLAWLPTYLVKSRGFDDKDLIVTTIPFLLGAASNGAGGLAGDAFVKRLGLTEGRKLAGYCGLGIAVLCLSTAATTAHAGTCVALLSLAYAGITFQQPSVWAVCVDIGGHDAGSVSGFMNTAAQAGSFALAVSYGYIVKLTGSYDAALIPVAAMLLAGILFWSRIKDLPASAR
ncbi:MAG: MFS transporter [Bryobacteraceae bacterium]|nr:MFS transporter [Bryobacteraceae bacterium]